MGSRVGVLKVAAGRTGLSVDDYMARRLAGEKWCTAHKAWHPTDAFARDGSRSDGMTATCVDARNEAARARYEPRERERGRRFVAARDDDRAQARRRVNYLVDAGLLPDPDDVPCTDCGHIGAGRRRHEYDHHRGYAAEHHEDVEPVCSRCHHDRERARG